MELTNNQQQIIMETATVRSTEGGICVSVCIKAPYPGIKLSSNSTLGGNQRVLKSQTLQRCGCGVVAALDLVRYLHLYHCSCKTSFFIGVEDAEHLPLAIYDLCAMRMQRNFVPALYPIGTTVFSLSAGLNQYFKRYHIPLKASWGVSKENVWTEMERMLRQNFPVILSIGHQFPGLGTGEGLPLYRYQGERMVKAAHVRGHYVTVVAMSDHWLKVTSWGQIYYISRNEFLCYRDQTSLNLLCNMLQLRAAES